MKTISDVELIDSIQRGNWSDFTILVNRYQDRGFALLRRILRNESDAEEALQDAFMKAYRSISSFRKEAGFSTWFFRIVYNTALSKLSSKQRKIDSITDTIEPEVNSFSFTAPTIDEETEKLLSSLIEELPTNYITVLNLFYYEELSCIEIAKIIGSTESNVKVLLHRSREALRKRIEKRSLRDELR